MPEFREKQGKKNLIRKYGLRSEWRELRLLSAHFAGASRAGPPLAGGRLPGTEQDTADTSARVLTGPESRPGLPALTPRSAAARFPPASHTLPLPLRDGLSVKRHFQRLWLIFHSLSPTNSPLSSYSIIHQSLLCRLPSLGNGLPGEKRELRDQWPDVLEGGKGKQLMTGEIN